MPSVPAKFISMGGGIRLVHEDTVVAGMKAAGLSRHGFRKLCRAIGCPLVYISGGSAFIDPTTFQICMKCVLRAGAPDFQFPGAYRGAGKTHSQRITNDGAPIRSSVPKEELQEHWRTVVMELLVGRKLASLQSSGAFKRQICSLTTRLAELSMTALPEEIAAEYAARAAGTEIPAISLRKGRPPKKKPATTELDPQLDPDDSDTEEEDTDGSP